MDDREGRIFNLAKDLPGRPCNRNGGNKRAPITIPAKTAIYIMDHGLDKGEVQIDAKQGYYIVSLPLLYDSVVKK